MTSLRTGLRSLLTMADTPRGIAGGFALGLSLSLVPIPFAGMIAALALAPLLRLNLPATYVGTAVVNPVTGAFFYAAELWIGMRLLGRTPLSWSELRVLDATGWWALLREMVLPFAVGAAMSAVVSIAISWPLLHFIVARWQRRANQRDSADPS